MAIDGIFQLAQQGQIVNRTQNLLKKSLVLEFLGFSVQARQKRFTFDDDHFFVDLVFYNRLLRCYVLIDLKIGKLTHQDLGQMQRYVNYFDRYVKTDTESATIGIVVPRKSTRRWLKSLCPKARISMRGNTSFICRARRKYSKNLRSGRYKHPTEYLSCM